MGGMSLSFEIGAHSFVNNSFNIYFQQTRCLQQSEKEGHHWCRSKVMQNSLIHQKMHYQKNISLATCFGSNYVLDYMYSTFIEFLSACSPGVQFKGQDIAILLLLSSGNDPHESGNKWCVWNINKVEEFDSSILAMIDGWQLRQDVRAFSFS